MNEPTKFDKKWYSHKFKGPGLRYEIGIGLKSGSIVWVNGPYPAGQFNDQAIFDLEMKHRLENNEKVLGDSGYRGTKIMHDDDFSDASFGSKKRALHECINGRLKMFGCLQHRYRHQIKKHNYCLFAVVNIVQIEIEESGERSKHLNNVQ